MPARAQSEDQFEPANANSESLDALLSSDEKRNVTEATSKSTPTPGAEPPQVETVPVTELRTEPESVSPPKALKNSLHIEEIVVTAQKRASSIQEVPMTINAVSGEMLEKQAIFDFKDMQTLAPGLQLENRDPRAPVATLRGISFDPDSGASAAVDMYFNEVPIPSYVAFQTMFDLGQIEVLRGPQGTLRGRTSPAGAITIAARRPSMDAWEASLLQSFSTNNLVNTQLGVGGPLGDLLGIRLSAVFDRNGVDGIQNVTTGEDQEMKTTAGRIVVEARPTDALTTVLTYQYLDSHLDGFQAQQSATGSTREPRLGTYDRKTVTKNPVTYDTLSHLATLSVDGDVLGHTVSALSGYQSGTSRTLRDLDVGNAWPAASTPQSVAVELPSFSQELRLASPVDLSWSYMFGVYYERADGEVLVDQASHAALTNNPDVRPLYSYNQHILIPIKTTQRAVFGTTRFNLSPVDEVELGLRLAKYDNYVQAYFTPQNHPAQPDQIPFLRNIALIPADEARRQIDAPTGSASYSHRFSETLLGYLTYGRSFRGSGANIGVPQGLDSQWLTFDEETSDSMELGFKSDWLERRLRLNANVFYQRFTGFLGRSPYIPVDADRNGQEDGNGAFTFNADATSQGLETEITALPTDRLQLSLSVSYAKAVYDNAATPCEKRDQNGNAVFTDADGNGGQQIALCRNNGPLTSAPRLSASLASEYTFPVFAFEGFLRGLYRYNGTRELLTRDELTGYGSLNVFVGGRSATQDWELSLWAKNVLGKEALTDRGASELGINSDGTPFGTPGNSARFDSGYISVTPIREREIGVTLRYSFTNL